MIRLALPKGRNLDPVLAALRAAGLTLPGLQAGSRRLRFEAAVDGVEILLLKDWDLPLYVEQGIADCGFVGSDVLEEVDGDLLEPLRLLAGRSRLSLIGLPGARPQAGGQLRLATKYPRTARRWLGDRPWGAEVLELQGSMELAPLLNLADLVLDIVQTGRTLLEHHLEELEVVREVATCFIVNRAALQARRSSITTLVRQLEAAGVAQ
jgi:ATP phosphoribosyltransferase